MNEMTVGSRDVAGPLSAAHVVQSAHLIQQILKSVMKEKIHYDVLPGCKSKSLLKPGAEKILSTFRISCHPMVQDLSVDGVARFRVLADGRTPNGQVVGVGVGEASSDETKWKWRRAKCDDEYNTTPADRRRIDFQRMDGRMQQVRQVRTEAADLANTVLKMAKKRALVDLCLTTTAASDCFTQDIEDLSHELRELVAENEYGGPPIAQPTAKPDLVVQPAAQVANSPDRDAPRGQPNGAELDCATQVTGTLNDVSLKTGAKKNGDPWTRYGMQVEGEYYNTFDDRIGEWALEHKGQRVTVWYEPDKSGKYQNAVRVQKAEGAG